MPAVSYVLGIDPGQANDPTAVALLELDTADRPIYHLRGLHRFPLGTPYTKLPDAIAKKLKREPLAGRTSLAIDSTGVGAPVVEHFQTALLDVPLYAITITAGAAVTGTSRKPHVPKRDLIGTTSVILEQHRLRIAREMRDTPALEDELLAYRRSISDHGADTYTAPIGTHDDLVLALSLALWTAEKRPATRSSAYRPIRIPDMWLPTAEENAAADHLRLFGW